MDPLVLNSIILAVLFVVLSLAPLFSLTKTVFGGLVNERDQQSYGAGLALSNAGLWIHAIVFGLVVFFMQKSKMRV